MSNTINIGRKDVVWNYAATFLQIGVGVILLPFILRMFPQEAVADIKSYWKHAPRQIELKLTIKIILCIR
jgi:hypothetical protein